MIKKTFSHRIPSMQTTKDPKSVHSLLGNGALKGIIQKAQKLNKISSLFDQLLPDHIKGHCHVLNIKHLQIIVSVDSAAILTECRFLEPELLKKLKQQPELTIIRAIKFKLITRK